jgi:hypothetical protein
METITFWGVITAILSAIVAALEMITLGACLCLGFILTRWIISKFRPEMLTV